jgi:hypothetical protein
MAPPTTAPTATARGKWAFTAMSAAIGATAAMVPMEVPMAVATKAAIINIPGRIRPGGMMERPKLTVESTPPMALATVENPLYLIRELPAVLKLDRQFLIIFFFFLIDSHACFYIFLIVLSQRSLQLSLKPDPDRR